jgi:hypothetical protein
MNERRWTCVGTPDRLVEILMENDARGGGMDYVCGLQPDGTGFHECISYYSQVPLIAGTNAAFIMYANVIPTEEGQYPRVNETFFVYNPSIALRNALPISQTTCVSGHGEICCFRFVGAQTDDYPQFTDDLNEWHWEYLGTIRQFVEVLKAKEAVSETTTVMDPHGSTFDMW